MRLKLKVNKEKPEEKILIEYLSTREDYKFEEGLKEGIEICLEIFGIKVKGIND